MVMELACFVLPGQRKNSVQTVLDSPRYFVLKIEDGATAFSSCFKDSSYALMAV